MFNFNKRLKATQQEIHALGGGSGFCDCSPFGYNPDRQDMLNAILTRSHRVIFGKDPDPPLDIEPSPDRCSNEVKGLKCSPRPKQRFRAPTETALAAAKKKAYMFWFETESDYETWKEDQEEITGHVAMEAQEAQDPQDNFVSEIDLEEDPPDLSSSGDPVAEAIFKKLTRKQLANKLLVQPKGNGKE